jgi:hypothetical protein
MHRIVDVKDDVEQRLGASKDPREFSSFPSTTAPEWTNQEAHSAYLVTLS